MPHIQHEQQKVLRLLGRIQFASIDLLHKLTGTNRDLRSTYYLLHRIENKTGFITHKVFYTRCKQALGTTYALTKAGAQHVAELEGWDERQVYYPHGGIGFEFADHFHREACALFAAKFWEWAESTEDVAVSHSCGYWKKNASRYAANRILVPGLEDPIIPDWLLRFDHGEKVRLAAVEIDRTTGRTRLLERVSPGSLSRPFRHRGRQDRPVRTVRKRVFPTLGSKKEILQEYVNIFTIKIKNIDREKGKTMLAHMDFDGQRLHWNGVRFKATTGFKGFQHPAQQCTPEYGPIPEGFYKLYPADKGTAKDDGTDRCSLAPAWGIQQIPRGADAGKCEPFWMNWGRNRVRMEPADLMTKKACNPVRGGFYLHDSIKGYSHGCIEVEGTFFHSLRHYTGATRQNHLVLRVKYVPDRVTNGGTRA